MGALYAWKKAVEMTTGISIHSSADIGPGAQLIHFGNVFVAPNTVIGEGVTIMQGVTIGVQVLADRKAPVLGNGVFVGPNAVVVGDIEVGDGARISALTYVDDDIPAGVTVHD